MPFRLIVPRAVYQAILAQALAEQPNECCGMLAGLREEGIARIVGHYPLVNALASPVEYEAEGRGLLAAHRDIWAKQVDVLAVYHSHPTSPAIPSKKDLSRNYSEEVISFIISLTTSPPTVRGWWLTAEDYREAEWTIED
jgi:proteasome lid subunit RPN8/RPN11